MKVYQRAALPLHRGTAYARATCLPALAAAAPCLPLAATVRHPSLGHCRGATASNCTPVHPAPLSPPSLRAHSATAHGGHAASDMPARRPADLIGINFRAISARPEASEALLPHLQIASLAARHQAATLAAADARRPAWGDGPPQTGQHGGCMTLLLVREHCSMFCPCNWHTALPLPRPALRRQARPCRPSYVHTTAMPPAASQ